MQTSAIKIHGTTVLIETDPLDDAAARRMASTGGALTAGGRGVDLQNTDARGGADKLVDAGDQLRQALLAVATPVAGALGTLAPAEWTLEMMLGFKGEAGVPCIVKGEANGSLKVTVKWAREKHDG